VLFDKLVDIGHLPMPRTVLLEGSGSELVPMSPPFQWTSMLPNHCFEVMRLVRLPLLGPFWWHPEEFDEVGAKGTIFRAYDASDVPETELGYVLIADITSDPDEPSVRELDGAALSEFDAFLKAEVTRRFSADGRTIMKWCGSVRNSVKIWEKPHLVTAYTGFDPSVGKERIYMDGRRNAFGRKLAVLTCLNRELPEEQTGAIISSWINSTLCAPAH
jgi:hypothetical protein